MKPFLLVNTASGGGRTHEAIVAAARRLSVAHHVVHPGDDFDKILAKAVEGGADTLAAAGGDGTLCTVANVAMAHDLPMIVVPAGTRNHFALDLGLDLKDPVSVLEKSLSSGFERAVDVGLVNGTTFLNNASLGLYAAAVGTAGYRDHKVKAFVTAAGQTLSQTKGGQATLTVVGPGAAVDSDGAGAAVVMVVNNAYAPTFAPGARLRPRLDAGEVWIYVGGGLARKETLAKTLKHSVGAALTKHELRASFGVARAVIDTDHPDVPIAVDGEVRPDLTAPFEFASGKAALRLIVPDDPGPQALTVELSW